MKLLRLDQVFTLEYGKPLDKEYRMPDGAYEAFGANGPIARSSKFLIQGPCVIVGRKGSAGEITYVEENVWPLDVTYYVKHDSKQTELRYLFYILKSLDLKQFVRGVKPGLNRNEVYELSIPLPSIEEQVEIVKKLDKAFEKLDALEGNLSINEEKTNQLLHSLLNLEFISGETSNTPRMRDENQDSSIKSVPIGEVCTLINGGTPDTKISEYWGGMNTWITPAEMGGLTSPYLSSSRRTLTDEGLRNSSAQLLPKHSVILSSRAPIGHLVINEVPMASNQGCKGLIPTEKLNYKYLYYFLFANKEYLNSLGSGTTFAEISGTKLKTVLIPLPPLERQIEIVRKLDLASSEIDFLRSKMRTQRELAVDLRKSLLHGFISGQEGAA